MYSPITAPFSCFPPPTPVGGGAGTGLPDPMQSCMVGAEETPLIARQVWVMGLEFGAPPWSQTPSPWYNLTQLISFQLPQTFQQPESPQPPPPGNVVCDGASNEHGGEGHLSPPTEAVQVALGTLGVASVAMPSAVPAKQDQDWLSGQQHPVCVDKGLGNANHQQSGAPALGPHRSLPVREADAPRRNEPEENFYVSTESPLRLEEAARGGGPQLPDSLPQNRAGPSSEQLDGEQKRVGMLQTVGRDGGGFPSWQVQVATVLMGRKVLLGEDGEWQRRCWHGAGLRQEAMGSLPKNGGS